MQKRCTLSDSRVLLTCVLSWPGASPVQPPPPEDKYTLTQGRANVGVFVTIICRWSDRAEQTWAERWAEHETLFPFPPQPGGGKGPKLTLGGASGLRFWVSVVF